MVKHDLYFISTCEGNYYFRVYPSENRYEFFSDSYFDDSKVCTSITLKSRPYLALKRFFYLLSLHSMKRNCIVSEIELRIYRWQLCEMKRVTKKYPFYLVYSRVGLKLLNMYSKEVFTLTDQWNDKHDCKSFVMCPESNQLMILRSD